MQHSIQHQMDSENVKEFQIEAKVSNRSLSRRGRHCCSSSAVSTVATLFFVACCLIVIFHAISQWHLSYLSSEAKSIDTSSPTAEKFHRKSCPHMCLSKQCIKKAAAIQSKMDRSVDPCDDFFQFVCGNYDQRGIDDGRDVRDLFHEVEDLLNINLRDLLEEEDEEEEEEGIQKARAFYRSCINVVKEEGVNNLTALLEEIAFPTWSLRDDTGYDIEWLLAADILYETKGIFNITFVYAFVNGTLGPQLNSGEPTFSPDAYLNATEDNEQKMSHLKEMMFRAMDILKVPSEDRDQLYNITLEAETQMAQILEKSKWISNETNNIPKIMNISELEALTPQIKWNSVFNYLMQMNATVDLSNFMVNVDCKHFLPLVAEFLTEKNQRMISIYLAWKFLAMKSKYMKSPLRSIFLKGGIVPGEKERRWVQCVTESSLSIIGTIVLEQYLARGVREQIEDEVTSIISAIVSSFTNRLLSTTWITEEEREYFKSKAGKIIVFYPWSFDFDTIKGHFLKVHISDDDYLTNKLEVSKLEIQVQLVGILEGEYKEPYNFLTMDEPFEVNAFYWMFTGKIVLPLGILLHPLTTLEPKYLRFGTLGTTLAHELTHAFDPSEMKMELDNGNLPFGNLSERRNELAKCFIDQYSDFFIGTTDKKVDGNSTLDENIADNGAIRQSFEAYRNYIRQHGEDQFLPGLNFTNEQMYFIAHAELLLKVEIATLGRKEVMYTPETDRTEAVREDVQMIKTGTCECKEWCEIRTNESFLSYVGDPHSPARLRVNLVMANYEEFGKTFNCPVGRPMNPEVKCQMW